MEIMFILLRAYLAIGVILGIGSILTSTSKGFREYLSREGEEWTWRDDIQAVLEAVFLWPIILLKVLTRSRE